MEVRKRRRNENEKRGMLGKERREKEGMKVREEGS
jgi:hypothetical protein